MIEIRRHNGDLVLTLAEIPDGAKVHRELGGDHYVRLPFSTVEPFHLKVGDYIVLPLFGRFELTEPYQPKPNDNTGGYDYDMQFKAYYVKWQNRLCRYMPKFGGNETSFVLTSTLGTHLNVILSNINYIGETDPSFTYEGVPFDYQFRNLDAETQTKAKVKSYQNTDIIAALSDLANIFECEWWVDDNHICFGRLELNEVDPVDFVYGTKSVDEGKTENVETMSSSSSKNEYATRIYAFGASRNLPSNYRKTEGADITKNGVVQKRLMLPADTCPHGYYEEESAAQGEVVEAVMIDEDIYPKVDLEIARIETYEDTTTDPETEEEVTYTYYRLFDDSDFTKNFTEEMILEGETLHILFQSGPMNGMDFEVHFHKDDDVTKNYWEVIMNEDYGRPLPDTSLHPEEENKFVIYNWDSTKIEDTGIIDRAEEKLYQAVVKKLADMKIDPNTYTCTMRSDWYEGNMHEITPDDHYRIYDFGQRVRLYNAAYFENYRLSRIIGYEICLDIPYDKPQYIVGEATVYSRLADMQGQIDSLTMNGVAYNGAGGGSGIYLITTTSTARPSDTNAYSALRSNREFLSKTRPDAAAGRITFNDGVTVNGDADINGPIDVLGNAVIGGKTTHLGKTQFGSTFAPGLTGFGGQIDNEAHAELRSLTLWEWLEVPELRYNRTEVVVGNVWRAPGGGIIESAESTSATEGTIVLKLEDGEIGKIAVGDICMGIFHQYVSDDDEEQEIINDTEDSDDSKGNFHFSGFYTVYFTVKEITETDRNSQFKYAIRPASTVWPTQHHPCAQMNFVAYGNFRDTTRQSSRYSTLTYERYLRGVSTWNFEEGNIAAQFGDLSNLSIHGLEMEGYSAYLDNIYMSGKLKQLNDALTQLSQYSVDFGAYVDVVTVDDVGNVIGGLYKIDPDTQEKYDFRINSAMQVRKNGTLLTQVESREDNTDGTFVVYAEPVGCTCEIKNCTIYITSITSVKDGVAGSGDDDDFDYDAMRLVRNCYVNLLFDCEGRTTFTKQFPVTIEHDSEPFIGAELDNEHSGVSWVTRTRRYIGLPTFNMKMWRNNEQLNIASINHTGITTATQGVTLVMWASQTPPPNVLSDRIYYYATIVSGQLHVEIVAMGEDIPLIVNINVTCSAEYAGISYERTLVHTITKSTDTNVYSLLPDPTEVVTNGTALSTDSVNCSVICDSSDDEHYNVPYPDFSRHNIILVYRKYYTDGTSDGSDTEYRGSAVEIDTDVQRVVWSLYGLSGGSIDRSVLHDSEGVAVLSNGVDGEGVEYIFITQNAETPAPTIYDDPEKRQEPNYQPYTDPEQTAQWKDEPVGTGANNRFEFYAQRKKVDGIWQPFGAVKLWNRYTENGQSPYVIDLSNEQSFVPVDANGNPTGTYETSQLMLFKGTEVAFSDFSQIRIIPTNVSCNGYSSAFNLTAAQISRAQSDGYYPLTPSAMTAQTAQITVQATATGGTVLTTVYTINKAPKDGLVYSLIPTLNVIHMNNDGTYRDTRISVQVNRIFGSTVTQMTTLAQLSDEGIALTYQYEGSREFTPSSMTDLYTRDLCGNGLYTRLLLRRVSDGVLLDSERINVVSDGDEGAPGEPGADAHEVNPNILLRTVFDKTLDFVRERWTTNDAAYWGNEIHISTSASTMVEGRRSVRINATNLSTFASLQQNVYGRVRAGEWYTLSFCYFADGGTFDTYIYSGVSGSECIDMTAGIYVDGVYVEPGNVHAACQVTWQNNWLGQRHSVTFKMASSFPATTVNIIFRAFPGATVCICMPKLESGRYPTAYMADEDDLIGAQGTPGLTGCHERLFVGFEPGHEYVNQEESTEQGVRYVDFLAVEDATMASGYSVNMCKKTHVGAASWEADNTAENWQQVSINAQSAYFRYLITDAVFAKMAHFGAMIIDANWMLTTYGTLYRPATGESWRIDEEHSATVVVGMNGGTEVVRTFTPDNVCEKFDANYPNKMGYPSGSPSQEEVLYYYNFVPTSAKNMLTGADYEGEMYIEGYIRSKGLVLNVEHWSEQVYPSGTASDDYYVQISGNIDELIFAPFMYADQYERLTNRLQLPLPWDVPGKKFRFVNNMAYDGQNDTVCRIRVGLASENVTQWYGITDYLTSDGHVIRHKVELYSASENPEPNIGTYYDDTSQTIKIGEPVIPVIDIVDRGITVQNIGSEATIENSGSTHGIHKNMCLTNARSFSLYALPSPDAHVGTGTQRRWHWLLYDIEWYND